MEGRGERYGAVQRGALTRKASKKSKQDKNTPEEVDILNIDEELVQQYFAPTSLEGQQLLTEEPAENSLIDEPLDTTAELQDPIRPESLTTVLINVPNTTNKETSKKTETRDREPTERSTAENAEIITKQEDTAISTQLLLSMAEALNQTLKEVRKTPNCSHRWGNYGRPIPYTFAGLDHENPTWFLENTTRFLDETRIEEDLERIHMFGEQLKGEAKVWFRTNLELVSTYGELSRMFDLKYNSPDEIADVYARLYGEKQKPHESAAAFITRKRRMCERLTPDTPFSVMAGIIINQLEPELRSRLRIISGQDYEELIRRATQIETDVAEIRRINYRARPPISNTGHVPTAPPPFSRTPQMSAPLRGAAPNHQGQPPRPCTYCGAWHFHSQCPSNPYRAGNANGAEGRQHQVPPAQMSHEIRAITNTSPTSQPSTSRNALPPTTTPFQPRGAPNQPRFRARFPEPRLNIRNNEQAQ